MPLYAVYMGYGLFVVRADDEDHARRVAHEGPPLDGDTPAGEYGVPFNNQATVVQLAADGPVGLLAEHYG